MLGLLAAQRGRPGLNEPVVVREQRRDGAPAAAAGGGVVAVAVAAAIAFEVPMLINR
jgi:hypothetical protein